MATFCLPPRLQPRNCISRIRAVDGIRTPGGSEIQDRLIIARIITNLDRFGLSSRTVKFQTNDLHPRLITMQNAQFILFVLILQGIGGYVFQGKTTCKDLVVSGNSAKWTIGKNHHMRQGLTQLRNERFVFKPPHATANFAPGSTGNMP